MPKAVGNQFGVGTEADRTPGLVPDGAELVLLDLAEGTELGPLHRIEHVADTLRQRHGAASAGLRQPERDGPVVDVVPVQADGLAKPRAGVDQEKAKLIIMFGLLPDVGEQPFFLVDLEEADAAASLFLTAEFG